MKQQLIYQLIGYLLSVPCVLIAITFHEFAHGFAADKLGDPTPRRFGRLTLNPLKHLDILGVICGILFRFGWAKPVPINTRHFKHMKRDLILVSLAGPAMNVLLCFVGILLTRILYRVTAGVQFTKEFAYYCFEFLQLFLYYFYTINASLAVFNLLPIPPLDGSRLLFAVLPYKWSQWVAQNERYISIALLVLLWVGFLRIPLNFLVNGLVFGLGWLVSLIPFL